MAADIRAIFNAATRRGAEALLAAMVTKYEERASRLARWMEENIPEGLTVFSFPASHPGLPSASQPDGQQSGTAQP